MKSHVCLAEFHGNTACDNREDTPDHGIKISNFDDVPYRSGSANSVDNMPGYGADSDDVDDVSDHSTNGGPDSSLRSRTTRTRKTSHDQIEDVVTGFNRLLQMHDNLDSHC